MLYLLPAPLGISDTCIIHFCHVPGVKLPVTLEMNKNLFSFEAEILYWFCI